MACDFPKVDYIHLEQVFPEKLNVLLALWQSLACNEARHCHGMKRRVKWLKPVCDGYISTAF
jgi:hypothetical protein